MTRWITEAIAALADRTPGGVPILVFLSFGAAILIGLAWYFWPRWLPGNWHWRAGRRRGDKSGRTGGRGRFRLGSLRWRLRWRWWRRRRPTPPEELEDLPPDQLPDVPAQVLVLTADQLAAEGRYAEAVRERLRAMVRELIERGVIPFSPGWTVTELAAVASRTRPPTAPALSGAVGTFSEIWYGLRPARAEDDAAMRAHAAALSQSLRQSAGQSVGQSVGQVNA